MAGPDLKIRKIFDPVFEDFRKQKIEFKYLQESSNLFISGLNQTMKFRFLKIIDSNARSDLCFSRATCSVTSYTKPTIHAQDVSVVYYLSSLFTHGIDVLKKYLVDTDYSLPRDEKRRKALKKLLLFCSTSSKDFKRKTDGQNECQWAVQLAQRLLSQLALDSKYTMDHQYSKNSANGKLHCPFEMKDTVEKGVFDDTSFGCTDAWHGSVDILFEDTSVNVSGQSDNRKISESSEDEGQLSIEVKTGDTCSDREDDREDDQILAQAIVFSFLQKKQMPELDNFLIPSFAFNRDKVKVTFYDCEHDVLLQTSELDLFNGNVPDGTTIVFLWLVLNYRYFCSGLTGPMKEYSAKFFVIAGDFLAKYKNEITRHVTKVTNVAKTDWCRSLAIYDGNPSKVEFYQVKDYVEDEDHHT